MERVEDIGFGNLKLIQDPGCFCCGIDAVILADYAHTYCPDALKIVDLGTGNGIVPLILSHKNKKAGITGIEIQEEAADMARRSCRINNLQNRITIRTGDIIESETYSGLQADAVTCNPPYFVKGGGILNNRKPKYIARHETTAVFDDFARAASEILNTKGHFFIVHRPSRLVDIFWSCRKYRLEPKDIRFVAPKAGEVPNIVLVHCVAGGGRELKIDRTLYVHDENGCYTDEIETIYEREHK